VTLVTNLSNLKGRLALVTGATGFLGTTIAETLADLGANLILVDRPGSNLESLGFRLINSFGVEVQCRDCDLEIQSQRSELVRSLKDNGKPLSILVNNAAFVGTSDLKGWAVPFEEQTVDSWRRALEVNITAVFDLCKELAPLLKIGQGANIINIASIYGMYGPDWSLYEGTKMANPAAYGASKGALIQLTRWLSTSLSPNIRVNAISPGGIFRNQPTDFVVRYEKRTPLGRMATEDDFRGVIAFLASDLSNYVTGQNIVVDGGWSVW